MFKSSIVGGERNKEKLGIIIRDRGAGGGGGGNNFAMCWVKGRGLRSKFKIFRKKLILHIAMLIR